MQPYTKQTRMLNLILAFFAIFVVESLLSAAELLKTTYTFTASETSQAGRLSRSAVPSKWSTARSFPGSFDTTLTYKVKTFSVTPGAAQYVQVLLDDPKGVFFAAAFLDGYDPSTGISNNRYLGDQGSTGNRVGNPEYFQIFVPYGHTLTVAVNEVTPVAGLGNDFTLVIEGYGDVQYSPPYALGPDLTVSISRLSSFLAGLGGNSYTLSVTNLGTAPSNGTIKIVDSLPPELTAATMSGSGWTCVVSTVTCTTDAVLAVGATANPVTLTVATSAAAASSLINMATVSGGSDQVRSNNSSGDVTAVVQPRAVRPHVPQVKNN